VITLIKSLPASAFEFMDWNWLQIEPYYQELLNQSLNEQNAPTWLADWTRLSDLVSESLTRLSVATTQDTNDQAAETRYNTFLDTIFPQAQAAEQRLKQKLLSSGLNPAGLEVPLRKMRTEAELFSEANLPLLSEERKLGSMYNKIIGAQTITWEGDEVTLQKLRPVYYQPERELRERAWMLSTQRQLNDRQSINDLWIRQLGLRQQLAQNADKPDYREYRWNQMLRLDYTPQDCFEFQAAIEQIAVPAATRVYERHRQKLGVSSLRPWDLDQDIFPIERPALPSYGSRENLEIAGEAIFMRVDPVLGEYFSTMRREELLDLDNRKGKAPGAYCTYYPVQKRPFIFANSVGLFSDVRTLLHEAGHAFHNFESGRLPYAQQRRPGLEFSEVASMAMELLASPYLSKSEGGLFEEAEANRARVVHLERILVFWPYMAVVDSFQHWVYTHPEEAANPTACDEIWLSLWQRYIPGVDWYGLEEAAKTGWQRKQHIHRAPFYYVEYGVAQLGAVQVWSNALQDQPGAVAAYRQALAMGGTATLPELYATAGAKFAFDARTLGAAIDLIESTIENLEH
jgi:oligoendopeptidase F